MVRTLHFRLAQRLKRWTGLGAIAVATSGLLLPAPQVTADEPLPVPVQLTSQRQSGNSSVNQRSVPNNQGGYRTLPTQRNRRNYNRSRSRGRYNYSQPRSYYGSPRNYSRYYSPRGSNYYPRGGYGGYGGYGYPYYGRGYGYYGGRGGIGIGPLTFWW